MITIMTNFTHYNSVSYAGFPFCGNKCQYYKHSTLWQKHNLEIEKTKMVTLIYDSNL